jgi:ABC-type multidrug transport system fused ATPase/permease subunit
MFPALSTIIGGKDNFISSAFLNNFFNQNIINFFSQLDEKIIILSTLSLIILIYSIKNLFLSFVYYYSHILIYKLQLKISNNIFKKYLSLEYIFFTNSKKSELTRNVIDESAVFVKRLVFPAVFLISELLTIFFIGFLLILIDYKITLITFFSFFFITIIFLKKFKKKIRSWGEQRQKFAAFRYLHLVEFFNLIIEIKLKKLENIFFEKFKESNSKNINADRNAETVNLFYRQLLELLGVLIFCSILIVALILGYNVKDILPIIGVYVAASFRILPSINRILIYSNNLNYGYIAFKKIQTDMHQTYIEFQLEENKNILKIDSFENLRFEKVNFSYQGCKKFIIKNSNFSISRGSYYGIFGPSGTGKSSLILLLTGLLKPNSGKIILNDKYNINEQKLDFTKMIGFVGQKTFLLNASIAENIAFGEDGKNINFGKVNELIEKMYLKNFVESLPQKIDTMIGDDGIRISGGQKQRIAIARALYHNPQFLILDEATNSLDSETENKIINIINNLKGQLTIIFISHKSLNLKLCSKVFILKDELLIET